MKYLEEIAYLPPQAGTTKQTPQGLEVLREAVLAQNIESSHRITIRQAVPAERVGIEAKLQRIEAVSDA